MLTLNLDLSKELQSKLFAKLEKEKLTSSEYFIKLLEQDVDSIIQLGNGFYYNEYLDKFYNNKDTEINFTQTQKNLLIALIKSNGEIKTSEKLISEAWRSRGNVSIFTFRNMIKQIRDKTYYKLIKSYSGKGYSINIK